MIKPLESIITDGLMKAPRALGDAVGSQRTSHPVGSIFATLSEERATVLSSPAMSRLSLSLASFP
jgi:hypothetical protein